MQKPLSYAVFFPSTILPLLLVFATGCHKTPPAPSSEEAKQDRLAWNMKTAVVAYSNAGFASPKWDVPAQQCLTEFARARANELNPYEPWDEIIATNAEAAIAVGCNDPMVRYLYLRGAAYKTKTKEAIADDLCELAQEMQSCGYPAARKYYATARAIDTVYKVYAKDEEHRKKDLDEVYNLLFLMAPQAIADKGTPPEEILEIGETALHLTSGGEKSHDAMYRTLDKALSENWPNSYVTYLLQGDYYIDAAWDARGNGYADSVSKDGWDGFKKDLDVAQQALEKAWKLNPNEPKIAEQMMTVMLGQGGGRERMEAWFNRAMQLNTNDYTAASSKLYYLEPKWYGSDQDQLAFGRECVQSTNWGGRLPLVLVDAHLSINGRNEGEVRTNYWKQPEVWADVQSAFDRFFELNPDATDWYHNYVWYAYHAEQWDKLNELLPKLGPVNYAYFGGKDEYDKMVQLAKEHSHSAAN